MKENIFHGKWTKHPIPHRTNFASVAAVTSSQRILLASEGEEESAGNLNPTVWKCLPFCKDGLEKLTGATRCHMTSATAVFRQLVPSNQSGPRLTGLSWRGSSLLGMTLKSQSFWNQWSVQTLSMRSSADLLLNIYWFVMCFSLLFLAHFSQLCWEDTLSPHVAWETTEAEEG